MATSVAPAARTFRIAVLPGDGIGPEVIAEAVRVLEAVRQKLEGVEFQFTEHPCGAGEYLRSGDPLPASTLRACGSANAILLGAMGLPDVRWPSGTEMAPQLDLREQLDLYAGVRPIKLYNPAHSPLKHTGAVDFVIYRENTEGLFSTRKNGYSRDALEVRDSLRVSRRASERLFRAAFRHAQRRRGLVTLVDKANVLPSMAYFRSIFDRISAEFPDVRTERVYVDAAALFLVQKPEAFDVIVTENMFGDILSDLAAGIVGGMGMAPSGDIGEHHAVFQPSHGTAPDIAGKGVANPLATILSAAMMLDWLGHDETRRAARLIEQAVEKLTADASFATPDLGGSMTTSEIGRLITEAL
ncbi:MAG: isocitrate/isopropylmalate dehydrogenase family protein [Bryobacterales bacterium]|nr:isocitrate/isopropylmalate dehydrogenase family protein [Bryobacterales bacterium]